MSMKFHMHKYYRNRKKYNKVWRLINAQQFIKEYQAVNKINDDIVFGGSLLTLCMGTGSEHPSDNGKWMYQKGIEGLRKALIEDTQFPTR